MRDIICPFLIALLIVGMLVIAASFNDYVYKARTPTCSEVQQDYMRAAIREDVIGVLTALRTKCRP